MKILLNLLSCLFLIIVMFSCETKNSVVKTINTNNPLSNHFVSKSDTEKKLSADKVIAQISKEANLNPDQKLKDITLRKLTKLEKKEEDANKTIYVLQAKASNGISVAHIFSTNHNETALISEGKSCKCTSTQCSHGCNAEIFGGNCSCSHCSNECKKESTVIEELDVML
ncbi:hypothetical protein [Chryseobacterium sp. T1]